MREEFEEWAHGRIPIAKHGNDYKNLEADTAWAAWQSAWQRAAREQHLRDQEEITALRHKISAASNLLNSKITKERL